MSTTMRGDISEQAVLQRSARRAFLAETILWVGSYEALSVLLVDVGYHFFFGLHPAVFYGVTSVVFILVVLDIVGMSFRFQSAAALMRPMQKSLPSLLIWGTAVIIGGCI
ncbi:hypothetical protein SDC9_145976 [bioreactor metagenome]|uniref:Uncharacterized protein n=1 Tax=bioreactor metagenome TaxID=1076179 RepID=A0A645EAV8_9ZZZZ